METEEKCREHHHHSHTDNSFGIIWVIGWLFTIAFAKLVWWQILLGIIIWPYYLGAAVH